MVKKIEELGPKLEVHSLSQADIFQEGEILVERIGAHHSVSSGIAEEAGGGQFKAGEIEVVVRSTEDGVMAATRFQVRTISSAAF